MSPAVPDLLLALFWTFLVTAGLAAAVVLRGRGVPEARVRDLLHVGAGVWVFGWPAWERAWVAIAIPWAAVAVLATLPLLGGSGPGPSRHGSATRVVDAVTSEDERWGGLVLYALAFALLTTVALGTPLGAGPAAGALLALAWGDGLGGAAGSRFGRRAYHLPWAKRKTWLGSAVVAAGTMAGVLAWSGWTAWVAGDSFLTPGGSGLLTVAGAGLVAAAAEAMAPRGTDNLVVPMGVFVWLVPMTP